MDSYHHGNAHTQGWSRQLPDTEGGCKYVE